MSIKAHGNEENDGIDRMSSLPDEVRTHILSFVSTREAVQTCILSKRWINTWASVPDLKFDIREFWLPDIVHDKMAEEFVTKFELILRSVLEKRETSSVNRFQLWLDSGFLFDPEVLWNFCLPWTQALADCIGDVMKLGPQECLVEMCLCENLNLHTDLIFTCASLIYLRLQLTLPIEADAFAAIKPNSVNLPCLKTLKLDGVTMSDGSFKKLLLGCTVLEELVLQNFYIGIIEICSNTLKKLVLWSGCFNYEVKRLHISAPNLLYLEIYLVAMGEIMLLNMPSLVDASIYIAGWYDQDKYVTRGPKLVHSLSNVESLRLEFDYLGGKVLKKDFSDCLVFNNIKRLELVNMCLDDFNLASFFLHHSPKLQELTLTNSPDWVKEILDEETTQEGPGDALVQREFLKTVRIGGFKNDNEFVDRLINKLLAHVKIIGEITRV